MRKILITALCSALTMTACTFERKISGTISKGGYDFPFVRTNTEEAVTDDQEDFVYRVTYPDGTTQTFANSYSSSQARREMTKGIDTWLRKRSQPKTAPNPQSGESAPADTRGD